MKTSWAFYYHILKLCIPVFCFQTQDSTLAEWMEDGMKIATPVMTYVYQEDEGVDDMTVLAAWENAKQQEKRSKQVEKNNEKNTEVTPEKEENLENKVNIEVLKMGYPDEFVKHGTCEEIERKYGLDEDSIVHKIIAIKNQL